MNASALRQSIHEVGLALRRPEELALRWRDKDAERPVPPLLFGVLFANAALGLAAYGVTLGLHRGLAAMVAGAVKAPLAAGAAWSLAMPALLVLNAAFGSKLKASTMVLAALATVSFGALAMLASVPVNWFFMLATPWTAARWLINLVIFSGVGVCMVDVFLRVMKALEPDRGLGFPLLWIALVGVIGVELMTLLNLFNF